MKRPRSYDEEYHHRKFMDRSIEDSRHRDGGERMKRSESFSPLRRGYPKGFRSERGGRDRFKSEGSLNAGSGSSYSYSWQLNGQNHQNNNSSSGSSRRESSEKEVKIKRSSSEKDVDFSRRMEEAPKIVSNSSSSDMEMEEGELQPEPVPVHVSVQEPEPGIGEHKEEHADMEEKEEEKRLAAEGCLQDFGKKEGENNVDNEENFEEKEMRGNANDDHIERRENANDENKELRGNVNKEADAENEERRDMVSTVDSDEKNEGKGIDLEAEPDGGMSVNHDQDKMQKECKDIVMYNKSVQEEATLELMAGKLQDMHKDKGKSIVIPSLEKNDFVDLGDGGEGPSSRRAFELVFPSDPLPTISRTMSEMHEEEKHKFESLDLSLGLPGILPDMPSKQSDAKPSSPTQARSLQSIPSSFRTNSDTFTNSISFSGSQTLVHNPSCSLMQNSENNYEQSVKSRPLFQGVFDQNINEGTVWRGQTSNDPKSKRGVGSLLQRMIMNDNPTTNSIQPINGHPISRQNSLQRQLSHTQSHGSLDIKSEHNNDKRILKRESSSSSLYRSEQHGGEQVVFNGGGFERIISKIVSEPLQVVGRLFNEMPDQSLIYLKETISNMIVKAEKHGKMHALQEVLERRPDLTMETMLRCPRNLLEILVALKTGLPNFITTSVTNISSSDLVAIFLNLRCRNLACMLPVDDCECKVCVGKSGFCRECMCLICFKFDNASNTCGWVGCDICLHWCHTDCGLKDSHIRNGKTSSGADETTEMQFHCIACDHPSELFGFVKDVFKNCGKTWNAETLLKELQFVRKIFSGSNDVKGKRLCALAERMLQLLGDKAHLSQVIDYIMGFFSESEAYTSNNPSVFPPTNNAKESNPIAGSSKEASWLPSSSLDKIPQLKNNSVFSNINYKHAEIPVKLEKNPVVDELESVVMCKQAEAKMYQERADTAKREADSLNLIAAAKKAQIDEEYSTRIAKLQLLEAEERRRQKLEELQAMERAHREFFNMKMRMQSDISTLLLKMETLKRNFNT